MWKTRVWGQNLSSYIWRYTIHVINILVDYWRSVLWKTPITHTWQNFWPRRILVILETTVAAGRTTLFTWLLLLFWKMLWTGGWLIKVGCGMGAGDVRCKFCVRDGKGIRMSGFGFELLSVWTSRGAWVQGIIYCGVWMICSRKRNWVAFGARRTELICCRGRYGSPKCSQADLMFHISWIFKFEVLLVEKKRQNCFDLVSLSCSIFTLKHVEVKPDLDGNGPLMTQPMG